MQSKACYCYDARDLTFGVYYDRDHDPVLKKKKLMIRKWRIPVEVIAEEKALELKLEMDLGAFDDLRLLDLLMLLLLLLKMMPMFQNCLVE